MDKIILIGGGGHCKSCIDVIEQEGRFHIAGIVDVKERLHQKVLDYEIIATDEDLPKLAREYPYFLITIGQIKDPSKRVNLFGYLERLGAKFPVIVSPFAYVSQHAKLGSGTIVMHNALINAGAKIGRNCIINTKSLIEHDAVIEDHCHIATGVTVNGGSRIKEQTFVGSHAMIKEGIEIGEYSIVGGGVNVLQKLPPKSLLKR